MSDALAESIFHARHTICGKRLRPFTLWHAWLLDFAGSPFIGAAPQGTVSDLAIALEICSRPPASPDQCTQLDLKPCPRFIKKIIRSCPALVADDFRRYLADHSALPRVWSTGDGRPVRSNIFLYTVAVLVRHGRRTEREAWATGFGYARHFALALSEAGGNEIPLISPEEEEAIKEAGHDV
jgi:hypothetical protein